MGNGEAILGTSVAPFNSSDVGFPDSEESEHAYALSVTGKAGAHISPDVKNALMRFPSDRDIQRGCAAYEHILTTQTRHPDSFRNSGQSMHESRFDFLASRHGGR